MRKREGYGQKKVNVEAEVAMDNKSYCKRKRCGRVKGATHCYSGISADRCTDGKILTAYLSVGEREARGRRDRGRETGYTSRSSHCKWICGSITLYLLLLAPQWRENIKISELMGQSIDQFPSLFHSLPDDTLT